LQGGINEGDVPRDAPVGERWYKIVVSFAENIVDPDQFRVFHLLHKFLWA
jgi:hypothetical protein